MKLLVVCPDWFPKSAGLAQSCLEFCQLAKRNGHELRLVTADNNSLEKKGLNIVPVPCLIRLGGRSPITYNLWSHIKQHIHWCDRVILYSYMFEMNTRIILFRKLGLFNKPIIHMYRGSFENEVLRNVGFKTRLMKQTWDATFGRLMFTGSDKTISNSKPTLKKIQQRYNVPATKLKYVPNGYHLDKYNISKQKNKNIFFLGRLVDNKGVLLFENILQTIPSAWTFTVVGNGPLQDYVEKLAEKYPNLDYKGRLPESKFIPLLAEASILVLPSYAEGSPRVISEALVSGVVPISFAAGDVPTLLAKNEAGYSVKIGDINTFCKKLYLLITQPVQRKKMAKVALKQSKKYTWTEVYPKLEKEITS